MINGAVRWSETVEVFFTVCRQMCFSPVFSLLMSTICPLHPYPLLSLCITSHTEHADEITEWHMSTVHMPDFQSRHYEVTGLMI